MIFGPCSIHDEKTTLEFAKRFLELRGLSSRLVREAAIEENYAKAEEVAEMKYVVDSINPLEFVSVNEVKDLIKGKKIPVKKKK